MKIKFILSLTLSVLIFGCSTSPENKEEIVIETTEENHHHEEHEAIVLDNGNKWVVVPEMMAFIKNIENGVLNFSSKENPSFEDHQQLSILIEDNLEKLTSNCTMTGQGHDELHKWLLPFLDLSTQYTESRNLKEAKETNQIIYNSFKELNIYFE